MTPTHADELHPDFAIDADQPAADIVAELARLLLSLPDQDGLGADDPPHLPQ
ncbi:MAG: hypothetical protein ABIK89_12620 [Planctomycetota bacterium]